MFIHLVECVYCKCYIHAYLKRISRKILLSRVVFVIFYIFFRLSYIFSFYLSPLFSFCMSPARELVSAKKLRHRRKKMLSLTQTRQQMQAIFHCNRTFSTCFDISKCYARVETIESIKCA